MPYTRPSGLTEKQAGNDPSPVAMAALGPGEGGFPPSSRTSWGGDPDWESELYQGSRCLSWAVPASEHVQMWLKWKPHACLSGPWRRVLTSFSAVSQEALEGCCLCCADVAEGATETAGGGPDLEEALRKPGRKESLPGALLCRAGVYTLVLKSRCQLLSVTGTILWALSEPFHPHQSAEGSRDLCLLACGHGDRKWQNQGHLEVILHCSVL